MIEKPGQGGENRSGAEQKLSVGGGGGAALCMRLARPGAPPGIPGKGEGRTKEPRRKTREGKRREGWLGCAQRL